MKRLTDAVLHPKRKFENFCLRHPWLCTDSFFIKLRWKKSMPYPLNLKNPQTYNEKLQWLKLHDRNPYYTVLVDKCMVKSEVSKLIGDEYVIPTIKVFNNVEEIDVDSLPNKFVLKTTHDSGGIVICKDKSNFDIVEARMKLQKSLDFNYYLSGREYPYKHVKHRIIAEEYMEDAYTKELRDYKFFCFDGRVQMLFVATDRQNRNEPYFDFFDKDYHHIDIVNGHPMAPVVPEKPQNFEKMKTIAEKLAKGMPHVRIDLYESNNRIYFGEYTFFHHCGWMPLYPIEWDYKMGEWIKLPK